MIIIPLILLLVRSFNPVSLKQISFTGTRQLTHTASLGDEPETGMETRVKNVKEPEK